MKRYHILALLSLVLLVMTACEKQTTERTSIDMNAKPVSITLTKGEESIMLDVDAFAFDLYAGVGCYLVVEL